MMIKKIFSREADNYTLYGALFGTLFPIVATLIESWRSFQVLNLACIFHVQAVDPLLWIIDTAPLFLGLFARMGGLRQDKVNAYTSILEQEIKIRTADLRAANRALSDTLKKASEVAQEAELASRTKSEFLANMSHELRTPLNHIIGFTELVVDKNFGELNATQHDYLKDALNSSRHLLSLINDILDISKVEAGKMELESSDINLKTLLENSLVMIKEKAMKNGIQLSTKIVGIPETITADERKLKQIVYNLLSNAVKFTPKRGSICLMSMKVTGDELQRMNLELPGTRNIKCEVEDFIEISVTDTGIGLKPEDLERIFSPFEQVENSASRRFQGTGLGLSLTKSIVELHGGKIWAESKGERKGSTFSFIIPISDLSTAPAS
ncbi:sensor histidine kinase [Thermodesulfobacteriota bacterium]